MPPRPNPYVEAKREGVVSWALVGRVKLAPRLVASEPSPLIEALKRYLDSLP